MRVRAAINKALDELYAPYDALVAPARATVSKPVDRPFDQVYAAYRDGWIIPAGNLAGQPALSVINLARVYAKTGIRL